MPRLTPTDISRDDVVADRILTIVGCCKYASEVKIQNILYLSELRRIEEAESIEDWDRLLDTDFKAYFLGAFSEDIDLQLQLLRDTGELEFKKKYIDERKYTIHYLGENRSLDDLCPEDEFLAEVCRDYQDWTTTQIVDLVKDTWLFRTTDLDEEMQFKKYYEFYHNPDSNSQTPTFS